VEADFLQWAISRQQKPEKIRRRW